MSSESESDDDYVPEEHPEKLSEEESADDETEKQYENEVEQNAKKRKLTEESKGKKKRKSKITRSNAKEAEKDDEPEEKETAEVDPEEQKKKEDDLWAMFLDGTDTKPKVKDTPKPVFTKEITKIVPPKPLVNKPETNAKSEDAKDKEKRIFEFAGETIVVEDNVIKERIKTGDSPATEITKIVPPKPLVNKPETNAKSEDAKDKEKRIFEFAGETIVVEDNVIKERIKTGDSPATVSKLPIKTSAGSGSGITGVLGALNRKNKLSILEKSKLDWTTLKKEEGIEEEIQSHNKGKQGYLERRDFLERADLRQYEIERDLRMSRRSNR